MKSTVIVILIITILAAIVLGIFAYIRYQRRLDRALSDSADPTLRQHRLASPSEFVPWLLLALLVIWNAVTLGKLSSMSASLDIYSMNVQNQLQALRSQVQDLEDKLDAASSLLLDYDWAFGKINEKTDQIEIIYTLAPGSLPGNAQYFLRCGTQTVSCTKQADGSLSAAVTVDLFRLISDFPVFVMTEADGTERRQVLDEGFTGYPCEVTFPFCMPKGMNLKGGVKKGTLTLEGLLKLDMLRKTLVTAPQSSVLLKQQGTEFTGSIPISLSPTDDTDLTLSEQIKDFPADSSFRLWVETTTDAGYRVRSLVVSMDPDNDHSPVLHYLTDWEVYGADGTLRFRMSDN